MRPMQEQTTCRRLQMQALKDGKWSQAMEEWRLHSRHCQECSQMLELLDLLNSSAGKPCQSGEGPSDVLMQALQRRYAGKHRYWATVGAIAWKVAVIVCVAVMFSYLASRKHWVKQGGETLSQSLTENRELQPAARPGNDTAPSVEQGMDRVLDELNSKIGQQSDEISELIDKDLTGF